MNELIRKLADEADKWSQTMTWSSDPKYGDRPVSDLFNEKFAQLIVRECIGCCEQVISDPVPKSVDTWLNGGKQCIQEIKEHFGVEL